MTADTTAFTTFDDVAQMIAASTRPVAVSTGPRLSPGARILAGLLVLGAVISLAFVVIGQIQYRNEVDARLAGQCHVIVQVKTALVNVLNTATAPRSTKNVADAGQLQRIKDLNKQLHEARQAYTPAINALSCKSFS